ncbi:MAG TPA: hypothetical protein VFM15_05005, partial [Gammaproteobacteria bacterium]|nr:hypothetical protein [Gammaproteobacteria bacterium]
SAETDALIEPRDVVFLPDGRVAVSSLGSGAISFYDARTLEPRGSLVFGSAAGALRFDADVARMYFAYGRERHGGIAILDTDGTLHAQVPLHDLPQGLLPAAAAHRLYASFAALNRIVVFDTATRERVADWSLGSTPGTNYPLALNADGTHLFVAGRQGDEITVLDTGTGRELQDIAAPGGVGSMQFDARTHELYVAAGVGELVVYEEDADGVLHERSRIATRRGARTGLLDTAAGRYYLALPAGKQGPAEIRVYRVFAERHPEDSPS